MIGYIHPGASASFGIRPEFMASVLSVLHDEGTFSLIGGISEVSAGAVVPLARDVLTLRFLASGCDWLWCVDTDMVFTPGVLAGLWVSADEEKAPVVSAVCPVLDAGRVWPSAYRLGDEMNGARACSSTGACSTRSPAPRSGARSAAGGSPSRRPRRC